VHVQHNLDELARDPPNVCRQTHGIDRFDGGPVESVRLGTPNCPSRAIGMRLFEVVRPGCAVVAQT
jgi:hypothetical protein